MGLTNYSVTAEYDILDMVPQPVFVIACDDAGDFRVVHINPGYVRATGIPLEAVKGVSLRSILPKRSAETIISNYTRCLEVGGEIKYEETLVLAGVERQWRTSLNPAPACENGHRRIIGSAIDISDLRQNEVSHMSEIARLSAANDQLKSLAGLAAHDVRAPLANIVSLSDLVLEDLEAGDGTDRDMIRLSRDVASKSLGGIDDIMQRVHEVGHHACSNDTEFQLHTLCRDLAGLVDPASELDIRYPVATIKSDRLLVELALRNLIDNASRFCRSRIVVTLDDTHQEDTLAFTVTDDGPGFGDDALCLEDPTTPPRSGTRGFGLKAVRQLLKSRGGEIEILPPTAGAGAQIRVVLPGQCLRQTATASAA